MDSRRADTNATTLRDHLRSATAHSHDMLDTSTKPAAQWRELSDYTQFLNAQYAARISVELWLSSFAPAGLKPPEQTPLLAYDLGLLGQTVPTAQFKFDTHFKSDATVLGAAWVLAGSSLGNKAMLADMKRGLSSDRRWPHLFLSSRAMTEFWKTLRGRVETSAAQEDAEEAARAARCVFDHFLKVTKAQASTQTGAQIPTGTAAKPPVLESVQ